MAHFILNDAVQCASQKMKKRQMPEIGTLKHSRKDKENKKMNKK